MRDWTSRLMVGLCFEWESRWGVGQSRPSLTPIQSLNAAHFPHFSVEKKKLQDSDNFWWILYVIYNSITQDFLKQRLREEEVEWTLTCTCPLNVCFPTYPHFVKTRLIFIDGLKKLSRGFVQSLATHFGRSGVTRLKPQVLNSLGLKAWKGR